MKQNPLHAILILLIFGSHVSAQTPNSPFDIFSNTGQSVTNLKSPLVGYGAQLNFQRYSSTSNNYTFETGAGANDDLRLYSSSSSTPIALFKPDGYVGIGTSSVLSKLHISGLERYNLRIYRDGNTANYLSIWQGTGGAGIDPINTGLLYLGYDQSTKVIIGNAGGSLGIGTSSPKSALHVTGNQSIDWEEVDNIKGSGLVTIGNPSQNGSLFVNTPTHDAYWSSGLGIDGTYDASSRVSQINVKAFGVKYLSWSSSLAFHTSNGTALNEVLRIDKYGNTGIGTNSPNEKLEIKGNLRIVGPSDYTHSELQFYRGEGSKFASIGQGDLNAPNSTFDIREFNGNDFRFVTSGGKERLRILTSNGNVGIGTPSPDAKLTVNGTMHAKEVKVDTNIWPDFVFEPNYKLKSLESIANYIKSNKHLPDVPSAKEVEENGVNLGEMNKILLQKIEELTLYQIEAMKQIESLRLKLEKLESK